MNQKPDIRLLNLDKCRKFDRTTSIFIFTLEVDYVRNEPDNRISDRLLNIRPDDLQLIHLSSQ